MKEHSIDIQLSHPDDLFHLFGSNERHLRLMEEELDVVIHARTEIVQVLTRIGFPVLSLIISSS